MVQDTVSRALDKVIVRLPDGMRDHLKDVAQLNKRSMNAEIVAQLEQHRALTESIAELTDRNIRLQEENALLQYRADEVFELRKRGWDRARGIGIDGFELPDGLSSRIEQTAAEHNRSKFEEIVQALEATFPVRPTVFEFIRDVIGPIGRESDPAKIKEMAEKANAIASENGWTAMVEAPRE